MPRQVFKIPLYLDINQKKTWAKIQSQVKTLYKLVVVELEAEKGSLGFVVAKEFFVERIKRCQAQDTLDDISYVHAIEWAYDRCQSSTANSGRRNIIVPIKVDQKSVIFSLTEDQVKVPYLGLVKYKRNRFITPGRETNRSDEKQWLLNNIRAIFINEINNEVCVIIDCSEGGTDSTGESKLTGKPVVKKKKKVASKWLE
ncbi:MAG: hypothetical protein WC708_01515 [Lentisphaeria bacterium]|jgi:hypothetical protein